MRKENIPTCAIKIGAITLIGLAAGVFVVSRLLKNKQLDSQAEDMGDTIGNEFRKRKDDVKDMISDAADGADDVVKSVQKKTEDVAGDIVNDYHKLKRDFSRKTEDILDKLMNT